MRGFGVVEYESAEQAEVVLLEMDRTMLGGQEIRLSLCTPGASGRSTLAALIAAQGVVSPTWGQWGLTQALIVMSDSLTGPSRWGQA